MSRDSGTNDGLASDGACASAPGGSKKHFDTFETRFFQQGDAVPAVETEGFDDLDEGTKAGRFALSRSFVASVAIGSACLALIGCIALWRSGTKTPSPAPSAVAAPAPVAPSHAPTVPALAAPPPGAPLPPSPVVAEAEPRALPEVAKVTEPAGAMPVEPAARESAEPSGQRTAAEVRDECKKAAANRSGRKGIPAMVSACTQAFAADPAAADIAVLLAKAEFDRGRSGEAFAWGKKAIAADPNAAEAYVYIGGAEQSAGRGKAAKEAYRRYLQLAPTGRYAADLRAIVGSL